MADRSVTAMYTKASVDTAGPNYTVVMLYDRLLDDIAAAGAAFDEQDYAKVNTNLIHAQEIVILLRSALNVEVWPAGRTMAALYNFFQQELMRANTRQERERMAALVPLVTQLRDAWRAAAEKCTANGTNERISGSGGFLA